MTRPAHITAALTVLERYTGIEQGDLGLAIVAVLGWLDRVEHDDSLLRGRAGVVDEARNRMAGLVAAIDWQLDGGPGDELVAACSDDTGELATVPAIGLGWAPGVQGRAS